MKIVKGIMGGIILSAVLSVFFLTGCAKSNQSAGGNMETSLLMTADSAFKQKGIPAVCLNIVHLREKPDASSKWLQACVPGLTVNYLNKKDTGPVYQDKNGEWINGEWFYIETPDNKKGWGYAELIAENAKPAVIIEETSTYSMPTEVSLAPEKLKPMDAIAIVEEKDGGWVKAFKVMSSKNKSYWLKTISLSKQESDFAAAAIFNRETNNYDQLKEKKEKDTEAYIKALKDAKAIAGSNSIFIGIIDKKLLQLGVQSDVQQPASSEETTTITEASGGGDDPDEISAE